MGRGCSWWHSQEGRVQPVPQFPCSAIPEGGWGLTLTCRTVQKVKLGGYKPRSQTGGSQLWCDVCRGAELVEAAGRRGCPT